MANELRIHMTPVSTFTGLTTLVAQIIGLDGVQVGSNITLTEDAGGNARYRGSVPATAAGQYDVLFLDTADTDTILATTSLFWDGTAEVDELTFRDSPPTAAAIATQVRTELTTELGRIDVATSTRLATSGYTAPLTAAEVNAECDTAISDASLATAAGLAALNDPSAAAIADAVWDEARADHVAAGSFGAVSEWSGAGGLDAAGVRAAVGLASANLDTQLGSLATAASISALNDLSAADVRTELSTELGRIDVAVSSRLAASAYSTAPTASAVADAVWDEARSAHTTTGTFGAVSEWTGSISGTVDANIIEVGGVSATSIDDFRADVSSLATAASIAALNDLSAAQVNAECDTAIADASLATSADLAAAPGAIANAVWDEARSGHTTAGSFGAVSEWAGGGLTQADVRTAVGLASANLDTQLAGLNSAHGTTQSAIAGLNDISPAEVNAQCDTAISDAALATAASVSALNDPTAAAVASAVRSELATELGRVDVAVSTRLASAAYTAPLDASATQAAAAAAITAAEPISATVSGTVTADIVSVAGSAVAGIADFQSGATQITQLDEIHKKFGLDPSNPAVYPKTNGQPTAIRVPADGSIIDCEIDDNPSNTTVTRQ